MQALQTFDAETYTGDPSREQVYLFQSAHWGVARGARDVVLAARPAFSTGGFPLPQCRHGRMLVVDAGLALPPCGGYMEDKGRNRYIDGCSCSLLVMPPNKGDPCVNHLHIAPRTQQSEHHHPSDRIGMVVRGRGLAHHEDGAPMVLEPGRAWRLPAGSGITSRPWMQRSTCWCSIPTAPGAPPTRRIRCSTPPSFDACPCGATPAHVTRTLGGAPLAPERRRSGAAPSPALRKKP